MGSITRNIRRNIAANKAKEDGFKRSTYFEWRRSYIEQLLKTLKNPKTSKKERKEAIKDLKSLKF